MTTYQIYKQPELLAVFYDTENNVLKTLGPHRDENYLIAQSSIILEDLHDAQCCIENCDTHDCVLRLKRDCID